MTETAMREFWVFEPNLVWTLLLLSHVVKYDLDNNDVNAVKYGLTSTTKGKNLWWTYQLTGDQTIDLRFAREAEDTDIIFIELHFDKKLSAQIDLCIFVVQDFYLQHRNYHTDLKVYE
jgi:hypothetical protein